MEIYASNLRNCHLFWPICWRGQIWTDKVEIREYEHREISYLWCVTYVILKICVNLLSTIYLLITLYRPNYFMTYMHLCNRPRALQLSIVPCSVCMHMENWKPLPSRILSSDDLCLFSCKSTGQKMTIE